MIKWCLKFACSYAILAFIRKQVTNIQWYGEDNMTAQEFIKQGKTFIIITINDELWIDCYKTTQVEITNEGKSIEVHEDANHNAYMYLNDTEVNGLYMHHQDWDDGHTYDVLIYDATRSESLKAAYEKLSDIIAKLSSMKDRIDSFRNFVYYDMLDKIRKEKG